MCSRVFQGVSVLYNLEWICYRVDYFTRCSIAIQLRVNVFQGVPVLYKLEWICYRVLQRYTTVNVLQGVPGAREQRGRRLRHLLHLGGQAVPFTSPAGQSPSIIYI